MMLFCLQLDQLYEDVGVHSLLITTDGDIVTLGTGKGKMFLLERQDLPQDFTSFCLKGNYETRFTTGLF